MEMTAPSWVLDVGCYFGLITCDTPPGVWYSGTPSVIATTPPSLTATSPSSVGSSSAPSLTSSSSSFSSSSSLPSSTTSSLGGSQTSSSLSSSVASHSSSGALITSSSAVSSSSPTSSSTPSASGLVSSNILVIGVDSDDVGIASSGLNAYGIPFTTLIVPSTGIELPALNSSSGGNFGGIVISGQVQYDYGGTTGYASALTDDQWNQLYAYQLAYGVRMVQYNVYPDPDEFGTTAIGGCCDTGVEQEIYFSDISDFTTSGLITGSAAGVSTENLYHYPATITNTTTTTEIAQFAANSAAGFPDISTAAVINDFDGRQQIVFFIAIDTTWSSTSNYLQHAWITWMTRGLYAGYRRANFNTQIDDMFLTTAIYSPNGTDFRITVDDLEGIVSWLPSITSILNPGSTYFPETGHNGNGNIGISAGLSDWNDDCDPYGGIFYTVPPVTPQEFVKPLGTGTNLWPVTPTVYNYTTTCTNWDPLLIWWMDPSNLNTFAHLSHSFTHEDEDNATYSDVYREISFNQAWLLQNGISSAERFTSNGIIPPSITGLHNGDALQAWWNNGITNCVGDNSRHLLMNTENVMWPYFTTTANDGFDGMQVNGRWPTRIYFDCYTPDCTVLEWINTDDGNGTFDDLLAAEMADTMSYLFGLRHDPYMFHQANLRNTNMSEITYNGVTAQISLFQAWVETMVQEFVRLVTWPLVTLKHADMSAGFLARYTRDQCGYSLTYATSNQNIIAVTLSATDNTCSTPIPVTFPVAPTSTQGFTTEQLGSDPLTVWVQLSGSPVTFTLSTPIPL